MSLDKFGRSTLARNGGGGGENSMFSSQRRGFVFTADGNIDVEKVKLCNVQSPTEDDDAVNKKYVDTIVTDINSFRKHTTSRLDKQKTNISDIKKTIKTLTVLQSDITSLSNTMNRIEKEINQLKGTYNYYEPEIKTTAYLP